MLSFLCTNTQIFYNNFDYLQIHIMLFMLNLLYIQKVKLFLILYKWNNPVSFTVNVRPPWPSGLNCWLVDHSFSLFTGSNPTCPNFSVRKFVSLLEVWLSLGSSFFSTINWLSLYKLKNLWLGCKTPLFQSSPLHLKCNVLWYSELL